MSCEFHNLNSVFFLSLQLAFFIDSIIIISIKPESEILKMLTKEYIKTVVSRELESDIGSGDITSLSVLPDGCRADGEILVKDTGVLAGIDFAAAAFKLIEENIIFERLLSEGDAVKHGDYVAKISGDAVAVLSAERTALNIICRLSGIATSTKKFVDETAGTKTTILDTRKTTPGLRPAEKYAVTSGGGKNHRFGLYDMILVKDNHIAAAGGIEIVLEKLYSAEKPSVPVEIEVTDISQLTVALNYPVDRIMLDNFIPDEVAVAIRLRESLGKKVPFECSGGINLDNVRQFAETGVEFISTGQITHSAPQLDMSLEIMLI